MINIYKLNSFKSDHAKTENVRNELTFD